MTLLFYYTLLIMFFYTIVAATSLSAFYVSHRRTFLYATLGFTFYFFDVSLVFKDNFITPDAVFEAASFYDVGHPYTSIITGGGAFLFLAALTALTFWFTSKSLGRPGIPKDFKAGDTARQMVFSVRVPSATVRHVRRGSSPRSIHSTEA